MVEFAAMERLKNFGRIVLASVAVSGGSSFACNSGNSDRYYISSCSTDQIVNKTSPLTGDPYPQTFMFLERDDVKKNLQEVNGGDKVIVLSHELFSADVRTEEEAHGRPTREFGGMYQVAAALPETAQSFLDSVKQKVNVFLTDAKKVKDVQVYMLLESDLSANINGRPRLNKVGDNLIHLELRPDTEISLDEIEKTEFHEGMHVFFNELGPGKSFGWGGESEQIWEMLHETSKASFDRADDFMGKHGFDNQDFVRKFTYGRVKTLGNLYNLVTESCYSGTGGHPQDNPHEMFASTATVMRYFPKSYLASIDKLGDEDKSKMEKLSRYVLNQLINNAADKDLAKAQFDSEIIARFLD